MRVKNTNYYNNKNYYFLYSGLENLQTNRRSSLFCSFVNLNEMVMCLEDLINYFAQPEEDMGIYN